VSIVDEPRQFRSFAELDAFLDDRLKVRRKEVAAGMAPAPSPGLCPDCGGDRPRSATRCPRCAKIRRRRLARKRQQKRRAKQVEQLSRFCEIGPFIDKDLQTASIEVGPGGHSTEKRDRNGAGGPDE